MTQKRWLEQYFLILIIMGLFVLVIFPLLTPVALGFLLVPPFYPLYRKLKVACGNRPTLAATLITLFFTLCIVLPLGLIGMGVAKEATKIVRALTEYMRSFDLQNSLTLLRENPRWSQFIPFSEEEIMSRGQEMLTQAGSFLAGFLANFASQLPIVGLNIILFLISFFYALVDGEAFAKYLALCLPFDREEISDLFSTTQKICYGVVVGSVVAGILQGLIIGLAYWCLGVPGALLFGAITAVFSFVPILGAGPTGLGGAIYLYFQDRPASALGMVALLGLAAVSDNVVKPFVLKGSVELHPLLGLMSALGGLAIFGFVGLFLGPLFAAFMLVILEMIRRRNGSVSSSAI